MAAKVWGAGTGAGADGLWSTAANWTGDTVPVTTDTVTFDNTASSPACTVDNVGTFTGSITVAAAYTNVITQNVAITGASAFSIAGGTWTQAAAFTRSTFGVTGGTWTGGSQAMNLTGTLTFSGGSLTMTSGTCTITSGSFTQSNSPTFNANGGTIHFTGNTNTTLTAPSCTFNLITINKSAFFIVATTTISCPLGTNPTSVATSFSFNGVMSWDGLWTITVNSASGFDFGAVSNITATGSKTITVQTNGPFNIVSGATVTSGIGVTFTGGATTSVSAPGYSFGTCTISRSGLVLTIAANTTIPLGANPTITGSGLILNGTLTWTGTATSTLLASGFAIGATGTASGIFSLNGSFSAVAGATVTGLTIVMSISSGVNQTFAGGNLTYAGFVRTGSGAGGVTITGTNTFDAFVCNAGLVAVTLVFPNVTTTVGFFDVRGVSGKLVTMARTGGAGTFTITKNSSGPVTSVDYISVSNSTVDVTPAWYAGANSTDGGGNTNWIFAAYNVKLKKQLVML